MTEAEPTSPWPDPGPEDAADPASPARRVVVPVMVGLVAIVAVIGTIVAFTMGSEPTTVASFDTASATVTVAPSTTAEVTTTTTTAPTTTVTTTTLPRQSTQPIAPPQDARGPENNPPLGRIAIPKVGLDAELEQGIRLTTLDRGPGHWPGSALPGEIGNVVVAGHRTSHGAEFRYLDQLAPGDEVIFTTDTGTHTYLVTGTQIVTPNDLWITNPTDTPTATLFACHPLGSTAKRIVVSLALAT
jgi:sortase A